MYKNNWFKRAGFNFMILQSEIGETADIYGLDVDVNISKKLSTLLDDNVVLGA